MGLIKKLRHAKKEAPPNEKPAVVKTHLRNMIIVPEMIGSVVGIYNGKTFNSVEIKPEMTGHYLAEFSISYKPVKHGRPGIGATHCTYGFVPKAPCSSCVSVAVHSSQVDLGPALFTRHLYAAYSYAMAHAVCTTNESSLAALDLR